MQNLVEITNNEEWLAEQELLLDTVLNSSLDKSIEEYADALVTQLCKTMEGLQAVMYIANDESDTLKPVGTFACEVTNIPALTRGMGISGQAAVSGRLMVLELNNLAINVKTAITSIKPQGLYALPVFFNKDLLCVIEIFTYGPPQDYIKGYLNKASSLIATTLIGMLSQSKFENLLNSANTHNLELKAKENKIEEKLNQLQLERLELERHKSAQDKFVTLVENMNEVVMMLDLHLKILFINKVGKKIYGLNKNMGYAVKSFFSPVEWLRIKKTVLPEVTNKGEWKGTLESRNIGTGANHSFYSRIWVIRDEKTDKVINIALIQYPESHS